MKQTKKDKLSRRHLRVRHKVSGTSERPRLYVRKSLKHLYAQVVDDSSENGSRTLAVYSTSAADTRGKHMCNLTCAQTLGKLIGSDLKARGIEAVVFDRGGYRYHGIVKAIADSVRETGVKF